MLKAVDTIMRATQPGHGAVSARRAPGSPEVPEPADHPAAARRADALVTIAHRLLAADPTADLGGAHAASAPAPSATAACPYRVIVHADLHALAAHPDVPTSDRACLDTGAPLPLSVLRRIACDADLLAVIEDGGLPTHTTSSPANQDGGRSRRVVTGRLRRALQMRDVTCRFPGCAVAASDTHAHHVKHWIDGGRTDLSNLLSLCGFHHRRHHDGVFDVAVDAEGQPHFRTAGGRAIGDPAGPALRRRPPGRRHLRRLLPGPTAPRIDADTPRAGSGGSPLDLRYTVSVICDEVGRRAGLFAPATGPAPP